MAYTTGDRLKFTGTSGIYSTVKTDIPASDKTITFNFISCIDAENNNYPIVEIGDQVWMAENLKTTKYRNGDLIGTTKWDTEWESTPKYQWAYDLNESIVDTYGRLYTWYAVNDSRNVCPADWHVPTDAEWTTLTTYLGGEDIAGGKLKETGTVHWDSSINTATNESGFTALPGGYRFITYSFYTIRANGYWWSSTEISTSYACFRSMGADYYGIYYSPISAGGKPCGYSVRCLKDN